LFKRVHTKFSLQFLDIPTTFYEFWNFETISGIYLNKKEKKWHKQCMGRIRPMASAFRAWQPMERATPAYWRGSTNFGRPAHAVHGCARDARSAVVTARWTSVR
jgi:hypothetical protein